MLLAGAAAAQGTYYRVAGPNPPIDFFGQSIAALGDVDGDARPDFIVGSFSGGGRATVWSGATGAPLFNIPGPTVNDHFGISVSGAGDVDGDGRTDFIVGASRWPGNSGPGYARLHSGATGAVIRTYTGTTTADAFGSCVADAGDVNGDGVTDVIVAGYNGSTTSTYANVYSGATGAIIQSITGFSVGSGTPTFCNVSDTKYVNGCGDVNGDGLADLIVGSPVGNQFRVIAGNTNATLFTIPGPAGSGASVTGIGDVNGDGFADFAAGAGILTAAASSFSAYSGATGALLYTVPGIGGILARAGGDFNGDGCPDLVVGNPTANADIGTVTIVCAQTGAVVTTFAGQAPYARFGRCVAGLGDVNADLRADVATTDRTAINSALNCDGSAWILSAGGAIVPAFAASLGGGCGGPAGSPALTVTTPFLMSSVTISAAGLAPSVAGFLFLSPPAPATIAIGGSCVVFLDLATFWTQASFTTTSSGTWSTSLPLPGIPTWAGAQIVLQIAATPGTGPLGIDLTNAVLATLGY